MKNFDFYRPKTTDEASEVFGKVARAMPKSGGTDLLPQLKERLASPAAIVDLSQIAGLTGIAQTGGGRLRIGAMTTLTAVGDDKTLRMQAPAFAEAGGTAATPLIRNRGTVGGNLCQRPRCWYLRNPEYDCSKKGGAVCFAQTGENKYHAIYDNSPCAIVHPSNLAPAVLAHDGSLTVRGPKGERTVQAIDFWTVDLQNLQHETVLRSGEYVSSVELAPSKGSAYVEVKEKQSFDWALASAACRIDLQGGKVGTVRVVTSHVAPTPLRWQDAEAVLQGKAFSDQLAWQAGDVVAKAARPLRDNAYKVELVQAVVAHALIEAHSRAQKGGR